MVAVAAVAVGAVAADAVVAVAVEAAAAAAAAAAACRGEPAEFAKQEQLGIASVNTGRNGRVRQNRPGQSMFTLPHLHFAARVLAQAGRASWPSGARTASRNAGALYKEISVIRENALHRQAGMMARLRVPTS